MGDASVHDDHLRTEGGCTGHGDGLAQWLGWLWPYAALVYVLLRVSKSDAPPRIPG